MADGAAFSGQESAAFPRRLLTRVMENLLKDGGGDMHPVLLFIHRSQKKKANREWVSLSYGDSCPVYSVILLLRNAGTSRSFLSKFFPSKANGSGSTLSPFPPVGEGSGREERVEPARAA